MKLKKIAQFYEASIGKHKRYKTHACSKNTQKISYNPLKSDLSMYMTNDLELITI